MSSNDLDLGEHINFSVKKRFAIITINRPERANSLTVEMLRNLRKAIEHCQNEEKVRGIVLTGTGKNFTTGLDLDTVDPGDHSVVKEIENNAWDIHKLLYNGKPVICAINGKAMGDGVIYSLASDYRIAVKDAFFQMPEINYGIFPGTGCFTLMSRILGIPWTKRILMFAEKITAQKALEIGLIDQIVESQEDLMKAAMDKVKFLFTKNQTVINAIKICSNHLSDKQLNDAYKIEDLAQSWHEYEDKSQLIKKLRKEIDQ